MNVQNDKSVTIDCTVTAIKNLTGWHIDSRGEDLIIDLGKTVKSLILPHGLDPVIGTVLHNGTTIYSHALQQTLKTKKTEQNKGFSEVFAAGGVDSTICFKAEKKTKEAEVSTKGVSFKPLVHQTHAAWKTSTIDGSEITKEDIYNKLVSAKPAELAKVVTALLQVMLPPEKAEVGKAIESNQKELANKLKLLKLAVDDVQKVIIDGEVTDKLVTTVNVADIGAMQASMEACKVVYSYAPIIEGKYDIFRFVFEFPEPKTSETVTAVTEQAKK